MVELLELLLHAIEHLVLDLLRRHVEAQRAGEVGDDGLVDGLQRGPAIATIAATSDRIVNSI